MLLRLGTHLFDQKYRMINIVKLRIAEYKLKQRKTYCSRTINVVYILTKWFFIITVYKNSRTLLELFIIFFILDQP